MWWSEKWQIKFELESVRLHPGGLIIALCVLVWSHESSCLASCYIRNPFKSVLERKSSENCFQLNLSSPDSFDEVIEGTEVRTTVFEPTEKMSTYLLAFIVCEYTYINNTNDGVLVIVFPQRFVFINSVCISWKIRSVHSVVFSDRATLTGMHQSQRNFPILVI